MAARIHAQFNDVDEMQLTMTITMSVAEWRIAADALRLNGPYWLTSGIRDVVRKAEAHVHADVEPAE